MIRSVCRAKTADGKEIGYELPHDMPEEEKARIKEALGKVMRLSHPVTRKSDLAHGALGCYSRYDIAQYDYAGGDDEGGGGYIETLHIKDAPDGRAQFIVHEYSYPNCGHRWSEWKTLEDARAARRDTGRHCSDTARKLPGFKRFVAIGFLIPWFTAVGDEDLIGDIAVGSGIEDDPVFRIGTKWVVDNLGVPEVKTCMGVRFFNQEERDIFSGRPTKVLHRLVYWSDGSTTTLGLDGLPQGFPRPLRDDEAWIEKAMQDFRLLLAGKLASLSIPFADGSEFKGYWKPKKGAPDPAGKYWAEVQFENGEPGEGSFPFSPTDECPTAASCVRRHVMAKRPKSKILRIKIKSCKLENEGKKWQGVFYERKS